MDRALTAGSGVVTAIGVLVGLTTNDQRVKTAAVVVTVVFGLFCLGLLVKQGVDAVSRRKKKRMTSASRPANGPQQPANKGMLIRGNKSSGSVGSGFFFGHGFAGDKPPSIEDNLAENSGGAGFEFEGEESEKNPPHKTEPEEPKR